MFTGSELPLVEFWGVDKLHILLEACPVHRDKAEIKCMGSVGGKTSTKPKFCSFFSSLRHIEQSEV